MISMDKPLDRPSTPGNVTYNNKFYNTNSIINETNILSYSTTTNNKTEKSIQNFK